MVARVAATAAETSFTGIDHDLGWTPRSHGTLAPFPPEAVRTTTVNSPVRVAVCLPAGGFEAGDGRLQAAGRVQFWLPGVTYA